MTVAIGAPYNGDNSGHGHVRLYTYDNDGLDWVQLGSDIDGEAAGDYSGYSVSLSSDGKTVAIGAPDNDGNGIDSGRVRLYTYDNDGLDWVQLGSDIDGEAAFDYSGYSVSLSSDGKTVAIGAPDNDGNGIDSGRVRLYTYDNDGLDWVQLGSDIDGEAAFDYSGYSVSLSSDGKTVAIGAPDNDGNGIDSGHVRLYTYDNDGLDWVQLGSDIDGEATSDWSGYSISLSSDGKTVAIGASLNVGVNGTESGRVRVHGFNGTNWVQLGSDIDGEATGDWSGYSVSLSSDGKTVAIGAVINDGVNGSDSGHARVYEVAFLSSQPTHSPSSSPTMAPTPPCPSEISATLTELALDIPDLTPVVVTLPVTLNAGCSCTIENVAIAIGINHPNVGDLLMRLFSPDGNGVNLIFRPASSANLVSSNKITFNDRSVGALNPQSLGSDTDGSGNILAGTYFADGNGSGEVNGAGLIGLFNGKVLQDIEGDDWTFIVDDVQQGDSGTIESVELTITCAEENSLTTPSTSPSSSPTMAPSTSPSTRVSACSCIDHCALAKKGYPIVFFCCSSTHDNT